MYLVDTNVLSEARRGRPQARDWLRSVDPHEVFLSVLTLGEIMKGVALKSRQDPVAGVALRRWLDRLRSDHGDRILPVCDEVALQWGLIAAMRPRNTADGLIAATAAVHQKALVTRNVSDFSDLDIAIIDPWNPG